MESLDASELPTGALLLIDSAPIIYILEAHGRFAARFAALFARHANHEIVFAVSAITIAEVPALARPRRMSRMRIGVRVSYDKPNEVRRICPPPSPRAPSISGMLFAARSRSSQFTRFLMARRKPA